MRFLHWIYLSALLVLIGCQQEKVTEPPTLNGYIVSIADNRMLVVSKTAKDYSATGGVSEFYNAISFSYEKMNELRVGNTVDVWADAVEESYPGQATAKKVKIYEPFHPVGADLNEQQAIERGLRLNKKQIVGFPIIKQIKFNKTLDQWLLTLVDKSITKNEVVLKIADQKQKGLLRE